jgi:hypothetical protein
MNQEYFPTSIKSFIKDCEDSGLKEVNFFGSPLVSFILKAL